MHRVECCFWTYKMNTEWWDQFMIQIQNEQHQCQNFWMWKSIFLEFFANINQALSGKRQPNESCFDIREQNGDSSLEVFDPGSWSVSGNQFGIEKYLVAAAITQVYKMCKCASMNKTRALYNV